MNKDFLIGIGLSDDSAEQVMSQIDGNFIPKARFNEVNSELKKLKAELQSANSQLLQLDDVKSQLQNQSQQYSAQLKTLKINHAVDNALTRANAKNITAVKALLTDFITNADMDDSDNIVGLKEQIEKLKSSPDSDFLFQSDESQHAISLSGFTPSEKMDDLTNTGNLSLSDAIKLHFKQNF